MKTLFATCMLLGLASSAALAQYTNPYSQSSTGLYGTGSNSNSHYVQPYVTSRGTEVQGHYQTNPNNMQLDNYGTRGNVNPYTGAVGTRTPKY